MSRRANQPDTQADRDLRECLCSTPPRSFIMVAGAGSGKTTSLIKALKSIIDTNGETLRLRRQRIACITYTEIAAGEIWADVGNNPQIHVSTIHSFMWSLIRAFQADIQSWVAGRIEEKLQDLREQGIKGAEFERVLVVLDDDEGTHVQFSYEKYLGIKPLSDRDQANLRDGKETSVERTRRLFYVCCTRALQDLVVVLFTENVELAVQQIRSLDIFPADSIHSLEALNVF